MRIFFILILSIIYFSGFSQSALETRSGYFPIRSYLPGDFKAQPQIFDVLQSKGGLMYFANQKGVLEYDGNSWRLIEVGKELQVLTLRSISEEIYVGADGDFGKLVHNQNGSIHFESLLKTLSLDSIGRVKKIININDSTFSMFTNDNIYIVHQNNKVDIIKPETEVANIFWINKTFFVEQKDLGIYTLSLYGDKVLKEFKNGYEFANKKIRAIEVFGEEIIIVTESNGIYKLGNREIIKISNCTERYVVRSSKVIDGQLVVGTLSSGMIVFNEKYQEVYQFSVNKGLNDPTVWCQYIDKENNLWLGTNLGVAKITFDKSIVFYGKSSGLLSAIQDIKRFNDKIYITNYNGVSTLEEDGFKQIEGINQDCYGLDYVVINKDTSLFVSEVENVYEIDKRNNLKELEYGGPYHAIQSPLDSTEVLVLHFDGLSKLKWNGSSFDEVGYIQNFTYAEPFNFQIKEDGTIWIGTISNKYGGGVFQTHVNVFEDSTIGFKKYYLESGLPYGAFYMFIDDDQVYAGTDDGMYKLNGDKFEVFNGFGFDFSSKNYVVHRVNKDYTGNIWMILNEKKTEKFKIGYSKKTPEGYVWINEPFKNYDDKNVHTIYHDKNEITWLGGEERILRFDANQYKEVTTTYNTHIRGVYQGEDTISFGNLFNTKDLSIELEYSPTIPIQIQYSASSYVAEDKTKFKFYLEGYDKTWSGWTNRTYKEYNLQEGSYTFHVKAINVNGVESREATYSFVVLPPWYRTWWAYTLYAILFLILIYVIIRISISNIKKKNIRLEEIVEERTAEVVAQKSEAEKQRDIAEKQKIIVEEKNREILDSINYAKRLQQAILPPDKLIEEKLPESFVYYKPKDIVAGDFYWMEANEDGVYIAAADCTGHGVPGAMVSVVCSNALDRTVNEFKIRNTGKILDKTTDLVIETFKKSEDEVKDGMDIALCNIQYEGEEAIITFSGANNPVWIVSEREDIGIEGSLNIIEKGLHLHEIKATKQPVGQYAERKPFESTKIKLKKGEIFYLFTDGFADQFGGEKEKKYKYKPFKLFFLSIAGLQMENQKQALEKEFNDWKRDYEQVDDVCVIGVRI